MKISSVISICKKGKNIEIFNEHSVATQISDGEEEITYSGTQWISNGAAAYCLKGIPRIESKEEFFKQYDVPEKQQAEYYFRQMELPGGVDFEPYRDDGREEMMARPTDVTIGAGGTVLRGISYDEKLLFVDEWYLEPFKKTPDDALEFMVRYTKYGQPYLYIREEMDAGAVIMPHKAIDSPKWNNAADELRGIWNEIAAEISSDREKQEAAT